MAYMAKVIRGADTADKTVAPESQGVEGVTECSGDEVPGVECVAV